jgi:hypothetical protein
MGAAKELNKAVRIFGGTIDAEHVIYKIQKKYNLARTPTGKIWEQKCNGEIFHMIYKGFGIYRKGEAHLASDKFFVYIRPGVKAGGSNTFSNVGLAQRYIEQSL